MISSFNIEKLMGLLKDFYTVTHIRITIFDEHFHEIACYPKERAKVCQLIRRDTTAAQTCTECDKAACRTASKRQSTYIYQCHAGLTEAIMPITLSNLVICYLFFGHVFAYPNHESGWRVIKENCKNYHLPVPELQQACFDQPVLSTDYIHSAANMMNAIASYLCMERMVTLCHEHLPVQIDEYIHTHLMEDINAATICDHFQIGKTKLYEIAKESYGIGIAEQIRNLRIEKAKSLLADQPGLSVSEVASMCGFNDYNYFITMFKRIVDVSPRKFSAVSQAAGHPIHFCRSY